MRRAQNPAVNPAADADTDTDAALSMFADTSAGFVGLAIPADCRPGVLANLRVLRGFAQTVLAFALPPDPESLEPFRP
jgi:hypothetical protein